MSPHFGRRVALLLLSCALSSAALAGVNTWTFVGPEGGQARAVAFNPQQPNVVLTAAGYSIYRSTDSGQTWTAVRNGVQDIWTRFVFDPTNPSRIMMSAGDKLWRSDDGGLSFNVALGPVGNTSHQTLAIAPNGWLYVSTINDGVFRSENFGSTWAAKSPPVPAGDFVRDLVVDPQNPATIYALSYENRLYRTQDAGDHWSSLTAPTFAFKLAADPGASGQLLLASHAGVYSTQDFGATWTLDSPGSYSWVGYHPSTSAGAAIAIGDRSPTLRRASRADAWIEGVILQVRSEDASFEPSQTDPADMRLLAASAAGPLYMQNGDSYAVRAQGLRASAAYGLAADSVHGFVYAAFASGPIGLWRRSASGWEELNNADLLAKIPTAFQPFALAAHGNTLFVASATALVRSVDGGQSWSPPYGGFNNALPRTLAFAPSDDRVLYLGTDGQGVFRTETQGDTWESRSTGAPSASTAIAVDPLNPDIAYVGDRIGGPGAKLLYKTTNAGQSWTPASEGLNVQTIESIGVTPSDGQVIYAGGGGNGEGLFKTIDGAASWQRVGAPIGDAAGWYIAIDPIVTTNVVMTLSSNADGAARSVDAGATWEELVLPALPGSFPFVIRNVTLDPKRPHVIIGSAYEYGLVEFEVSPDLEVLVSSATPTIALGGTGTATIRATNRGPLAASAVQLRLTPPAGAPITLVEPAQGLCAMVSNVLTCNLGVIRVGQTVDTKLTLRGGNAPASGTLTASVEAHESDPALANNSVGAAVATARVANLGIALARGAAEVDRGTAVTLTATATNSGPNASDTTQVAVALGVGLTYRSATVTQGTCAENAGTVTCTIGRVDPGQQAIATVEATAAVVGELSATAAITDNVVDPVAANNSATVTLTSRAVADAGVQINDAADPVTAGQTLQYSAIVSNAGPDELPATTVTVTVVGATVSSATTNRGSCTTTSTSATCTVSGVASGASATIDVQTVPGAAGTVSATAQVAVEGTDLASANNSATQSTTVNAPPAQASSGGGGGSTNPLELALLVALLALGRAARERKNARRWSTPTV